MVTRPMSKNYILYTAAAAKSLQSCPTLCDPIGGSLPGSPVPGILQAREWVAISFSKCMKLKSESEVTQSCPTPSDSMDCSLPGFSTHGFSRQEYWSRVPSPSPRFYVTVYIFWSVTKINHYLLKPLYSLICSQTYLH